MSPSLLLTCHYGYGLPSKTCSPDTGSLKITGIFHFTNSLIFGSRNTLFYKLGVDYSKHSSDLFSLTSQTLISTTHLVLYTSEIISFDPLLKEKDKNQSVCNSFYHSCSFVRMNEDAGLLGVGGVFLHRSLEVSKCLLPDRLHVLIVIPAVGLRQPGLQLRQVVRKGVASVRHEAGH